MRWHGRVSHKGASAADAVHANGAESEPGHKLGNMVDLTRYAEAAGLGDFIDAACSRFHAVVEAGPRLAVAV